MGYWTVADLSGHLSAMVDVYLDILNGGGHPAATIEELGPYNDRMANEHGGDPVETARKIRAVREPLLQRLSERWDASLHWLDGISISGATVAILVLGEFLVHGFDVAGGEWTIDASDASTLLAGSEPIAVHYVDQDEAEGFRGSIEVRIRGGLRRRFVFDGPRLAIIDPDGHGRADCYISGDPTTFVALMYGRGGPVRAALRGKVVAWGLKPWLSLKLPKLIKNP